MIVGAVTSKHNLLVDKEVDILDRGYDTEGLSKVAIIKEV